jgi:hypothetical protein
MKGIAIFLGVLTALLGLSDVGQAQPPASIQVQGTIRAVDCNAQTVALDTGGGSGVYRTAGGASITLNSVGAPLCALQQYPGAPAIVWLTASGNELLITRLDVAGQGYAPASPPAYAPGPYPNSAPTTTYYPPAPYSYPTPAPTYYPPAPYSYPAPTYYPPAPYSYPAPAPYYYAPPLAGIVLGTILFGGLVYLLVRHSSGHFYRYPYYGSYYRQYYRPYYRPYYGPYRFAPAYGWCPPRRGWGYRC